MRIHTSPLLAPRTVPVRVPKTDNARIRKKWLKKYGTKQVEWFYITGHRDVRMHPETAVRLDIEPSANKGHL